MISSLWTSQTFVVAGLLVEVIGGRCREASRAMLMYMKTQLEEGDASSRGEKEMEAT